MRARTRRIGFLAFDGLTALDLVGPAEVFALASALSPATRGSRRLYEVVVIGLDAAPARAHSGVLLTPQATLTNPPPLDTIFIPGGRGLREPGTLAIVANWLRKRRRSFRRIVSVCTGAWALAEAGMLDGGSATTHWNHSSELARCYPSVRVEADAIYVREGNIYTSAGITAGVDLALALVREDHGAPLALAVARHLVVNLVRAGGQRQFSRRDVFPEGNDPVLADLTRWMHDHLGEDLSNTRLAERCHMSTRQLTRRFIAAYRMPPATYVEQLRTDEACQLLLAGDASMEQIARAVGYRGADVFRRAFERQMGIPPLRYRTQFATSG